MLDVWTCGTVGFRLSGGNTGWVEADSNAQTGRVGGNADTSVQRRRFERDVSSSSLRESLEVVW
jgi:hypothetical protein